MEKVDKNSFKYRARVLLMEITSNSLSPIINNISQKNNYDNEQNQK